MLSAHTFLSSAALLSLLNSANAYTLVNTFDSTNFFDEFDFFTAADPTEGFVQYVSQSVAENDDLVHYENSQVYIGVDHTTQNPTGGRNSVRVIGSTSYTQGLFVADIAHMPGGICGTWPSFWSFGPNWPASGEIDIIEGVNSATTDTITLHTSPGCTVSNSNSAMGTTTVESHCGAGDSHTGCGVSTTSTNAYGSGFNAAGGGVYAMQWAQTGIYVWFFQRGQIPGDITSGNPDPTGWGTPLAAFSGSGCDFSTAFQNHNLIFDTTFCGAWAGLDSVWESGSCSSLASTCNEYVANNPAAFTDAYWLINSVKVYQ